jgi:heat shock protein HslJ
MHANLFRAAVASLVLALATGCVAMRARTVEIDSPPHSPAVLTASAWSLSELNGQPVTVPAGASAPNIRFDRQSMRASGNAGVNRFNGSYSLQGDSLTFSPLAVTKMAGPEELNELETRFLQALQETNRWRLEGDSLQFLAGERVVARFSKLPGR